MTGNHNFTDIFDCPEFKCDYKSFERVQNGRVKLDKNRRPKKVKNPRTKVRVNPMFYHEHVISCKISPADLWCIFFLSKRKYMVPNKKNYQASLCLQNRPT